MRKKKTFILDCPNSFKKKLIFFLEKKSRFCFLDSNNSSRNSFDYLAAFGVKKNCCPKKNIFKSFQKFLDDNKDWVFGHFSYDLKNEIEDLKSENMDFFEFDKLNFFIPFYIFKVKNKTLTIIYDDSKKDTVSIYNKILNQNHSKIVKGKFSVKPNISKKKYLSIINLIKNHIQKGDIYEMNFCQEFKVEFNDFSPSNLFFILNNYSQSPFASFYKVNHKYCLCSSPERYIRHKNNKVISQPIKGTALRTTNLRIDDDSKKNLLKSEKDFSENVMIVDLVRNDLSITAKKNSVKVEELAKLYSYKNVHHLISTISSRIKDEYHPLDVIKNSFPMGSMTGAPKIRSMELIEKYENIKRGLYSGSIGFFNPDLDFDFNVVIRSLLFNQKSNYLSFIVGGAITIDSDPNKEYEECLIKAKSILNVLSNEK
tara:strand:+ start:22220 stop:23500 length:1281 start_codon:yes stop_codon:yes gene_type:complete